MMKLEDVLSMITKLINGILILFSFGVVGLIGTPFKGRSGKLPTAKDLYIQKTTSGNKNEECLTWLGWSDRIAGFDSAALDITKPITTHIQ